VNAGEAYRAARAFAITSIGEIIRHAEETGTPYEQVRPLVLEALAHIPPNPNPTTAAQESEALRAIRETLAETERLGLAPSTRP